MHGPRKILLFLSALFAASAAPAAADDAPLVLGSYAYPTLDRTRALAPLAGVIKSAAGQPVEIRLYPDPDALAREIAAGEVDVAVLNLGAWLRAAHAPGVLPLAVLVPAPMCRNVTEPCCWPRPRRGWTISSGRPGSRQANDLRLCCPARLRADWSSLPPWPKPPAERRLR